VSQAVPDELRDHGTPADVVIRLEARQPVTDSTLGILVRLPPVRT